MEQKQLLYKNSTIHYLCFGKGSKVVLCFHGYGEAADSFLFLEKHAGGDFTFYAIDLPFHGKTDWKEGSSFTADDLQSIVHSILSKTNSELKTQNSQLTLLAYSLGGRMALSLYEQMPEQISKLVLLASDGLKVNFWYWLATQTWFGNKLFALTMKKPGWFFWLLQLMSRFKMINASIFKFVKFYIGDAAVRQQLYNRWTGLRKIKPHLSLIKQKVKANGTMLNLVYGKHDRIILSSVGEKFRKGIEDNCTLTVINAGHGVLGERYLDVIMNEMKL